MPPLQCSPFYFLLSAFCCSLLATRYPQLASPYDDSNLHHPSGHDDAGHDLDRVLWRTSPTRELPVSDLPNVDYPTITVSATLPGGSPETMAADRGHAPREAVLDDRRHRQHDVDEQHRRDLHRRAVRPRSQHRRRRSGHSGRHLAERCERCPQGIIPPSYQKTNPAATPILYLSISSPSLPLSTLDEYGETTIAQRLSTVSGVAQVLVYGSQKYAVRIAARSRSPGVPGDRSRGRQYGRSTPRTSISRRASCGARRRH